MNKQKIGKFSLLLIGLMLITSILLLPSNTNATETVKSSSTETISTVSTKDTYVDSWNPSTNNGGEHDLIVGDLLGNIFYAYFYFEFIDKPNNYQKAEISLYIAGIGQTTQFNIYLITEDWNEYSMNWQNKPTNNVKITILQITPALFESYGRYSFDISNYISGKTNISICITRNSGEDYVLILSRESESDIFEPRPQLIWTYEAEVSESDDNGDDKKEPPDVKGFVDFIYSTFVVVVIILVVSAVVYLFIRRMKQKQKQTQQQRQNIVINMPDTQQTTTMKYCSSCGEKINQTARFCPYCRTPQ